MQRNGFLIFIPTYNELENVEILYNQIKSLNLDVDFLFLDDNSPDGTGQLIDKMAVQDKTVFVIHREKKNGIGSAHQDGIRWAYE
ncbi:MAG TPA: glycosyltransferase, partial [Chitinophagaceae bacterium]|nr:glycosyltransferase [Chitinophagaceae bacterium]